jgi:hypothetical protein
MIPRRFGEALKRGRDMNHQNEMRWSGLFIIIAIVAGLTGVLLLLFGHRQWTLYSRSSPEPSEVSLADPLAQVPSDNIHIRVSGFELGEQYVAATKNGKRTSVYIPMFAAGGPKDPRQVKMVLRTSRAVNDDQLAALFTQPTLTGVITTGIYSLGSLERRKLEQTYPGIDLDAVVMLDHEFILPSGQTVWLMLGIGIVLVIVALAAAIGAVIVHRKGRGRQFKFLEEPK